MARPQFEPIPTGERRAFVFKIDRELWPVYHYHPEYDILLSLRNHAGNYLSGDRIGRLGRGTLIMNGPNIPHALQSPLPPGGNGDSPALAVIQFSRASLGEEFLNKQEMTPVRRFLEEASRGFEFHGETRKQAETLMLEMTGMDDLERFAQLLRLLGLFARSQERTPLASPAYRPVLDDTAVDRMDRVIQHIRSHLGEGLELDKAASIAGLTPKTFSRLFKRHTGKTFVAYLNELRISEACKLLIESRLGIGEIALEAGFGNLSHFNRLFRRSKGDTPRSFRAQWQTPRSVG
ncbi:MAG TPA: AraC family transcriptional regulator [Verrucomicrobiales bacterium]|nr:AraC family transcriptional regulator [Verrucomicrobiales bacterium]